MSLISELKRRNVLRVATAYVVASWLIIQVAETLFPLYDLSDGAIRSVVTVMAIGFLPVLIFSWVFELTPDGLKRQSYVDRTQSVTASTGRVLDKVILVMLVLALAYIAWDKMTDSDDDNHARVSGLMAEGDSSTAEQRKSIAVLPFANLSGDPANEPFTLGIHDDLLTHLSRIGALKTTSRTSVLQYRGTTKTIPEIATELGVGSILEGGIQRSGNRVRINMQLIDAVTDEHLWAEIYDRELTVENLFAVQGEIASEVTKAMRATLLPEEQTAAAPTGSMAAYDLYLLGRHHWNERTAESINLALDYFRRAIEEDPNYVLALSGLADSYALSVNYGNMQGADAFPLAQAAIDRAMELDDSVSEVWASQGLLELLQANNTEAMQSLERALVLDEKNFSAWLWYGNTMLNLRRYDDHIAALKKAYSLEPMSRPVNNNLAGAYLGRGDFENSRLHYQRVDEIDSLQPSFYKVAIANVYYQSGELTRSIEEARAALAIDPKNGNAMRAQVKTYLALGNTVDAEYWAEEAARLSVVDPVAFEVLIAKQEFEPAIRLIESKIDLFDTRNNPQFIVMLFRAAYLGNDIDTARVYLQEYLGHFDGRVEVNPAATHPWNELLIADFWVKHGKPQNDEPRRGTALAEDVLSALTTLTEQGFHHPGTYYGIAIANATLGDSEAALAALATAVRKGFSDTPQLATEPAFDSIRNSGRFLQLSNVLQERVVTENEKLADATLAAYTPMSDEEVVSIARETLERYAGYYTDGNVVVTARPDDKGGMVASLAQVGSFVMLPVSQNEFQLELDRSQSFSFEMDDAGNVTHVNSTSGGNVTRFKRTDPPPVAIELSRDAVEQFVGIYRSERIAGAEGEAVADTDILVGEVGIDPDGTIWLDFDNQPRLVLKPYSETEFFLPGFLAKFRFERSQESGRYDRMTWHQDSVEIDFERQ